MLGSPILEGLKLRERLDVATHYFKQVVRTTLGLGWR